MPNWKYKVTWQTEYNGKLGKDDEPSYFDNQRDATQYMREIVASIHENQYLSSDRQVVKLYWGTRLIETWDSMPKKSQVMRARANAKKNARRLD